MGSAHELCDCLIGLILLTSSRAGRRSPSRESRASQVFWAFDNSKATSNAKAVVDGVDVWS